MRREGCRRISFGSRRSAVKKWQRQPAKVLLQRVCPASGRTPPAPPSADALAVGRVGDHHARRRRARRARARRPARASPSARRPRRRGCAARRLSARGSLSLPKICSGSRRQAFRDLRFLIFFHSSASKVFKFLETEGPLRARARGRAPSPRPRQQRAAAAHRVEQRLVELPAREHHDARGEVLAQRRLARARAPAALEERLARGVEVERAALGSSRNAWMRTSGVARSTFGRLPTVSRNRSQTASLMRSVAKSRLFSGLFCADDVDAQRALAP